jgi:hypothetical protein
MSSGGTSRPQTGQVATLELPAGLLGFADRLIADGVAATVGTAGLFAAGAPLRCALTFASQQG